ncbi:MAG: ribonuclease HII [Anaerolineaceae bacterium]
MPARYDPALIPPAPTLEVESALWQGGNKKIAGLDEAGRGALAGPVCAGAVILPADEPLLVEKLNGVRDSKQLNPRTREHLAVVIRQAALAWGLGWSEAAEIDQVGIAKASRLAFMRALAGLGVPAEYLLLDYFTLPEVGLGQIALVKGDQRSLSIACASILAKTERDAFMREQEERYPGYGFAGNKGYGTKVHRQAIQALGACAIHRKSFKLTENNSPA